MSEQGIELYVERINMEEQTKILYRLIQERYAKVIWTHKIQLCQAAIHYKKNKCRNRTLAFLSCAVSAAAITNVLKWLSEDVMVPVLAVLTLILTFFTIMYKSDNLVKAASENEHFAATMHDLRNRYESLLTDIKSGQLTKEQIVARRDALEHEEDLLYSGIVPATSREAIDAASKELKINQDSTTSDKEIELLVSPNLQ